MIKNVATYHMQNKVWNNLTHSGPALMGNWRIKLSNFYKYECAKRKGYWLSNIINRE